MGNKPIEQRLIEQLIAQGMNPQQALGVARKQLSDTGSIDPKSGVMTSKGIERTAMGDAGRAIDRAASKSGRPNTDYQYDPATNRATLKKP